MSVFGGNRLLSSVAFAVLAVALLLGIALGPDAIPGETDTPRVYVARLLLALENCGRSAFVQMMLLVPGLVQVDTSRDLHSGKSKEHGNGPVDTEHDSLRQPLAKDESEINMQQAVSAKRYAELRKEIEDNDADEVVVLPQHPDEVRAQMPSADPDGPEMRCNEAIEPSSSLVTRDVELRAKSIYQGQVGKGHGWKYIVTFVNHGTETVQMLTRHWVFTDANRQQIEVKGPGARGVTPVLPPGGEWSYESGTSLTTPLGSMHGSFQFEVLKGDRSPEQRAFSARVGRLLLAPDSEPKYVACADDVPDGLIPTSSVLATERVILGGNADFLIVKQAADDEEAKVYVFRYDVQINNARDASVKVVAHSWEVVDSTGKRSTAVEGHGVGGQYSSSHHQLAAGDAFRVHGKIISRTPEANAQGTYKVIVSTSTGEAVEIEARTDWMGLSAEKGKKYVEDFVSDRRTLGRI